MKAIIQASAGALVLAAGLGASAVAQDSAIDLNELTIADIQAAYEAGTYDAVRLTQAYRDRIALYEPAYNAFTHMNPNALEEAAAIDKLRAEGAPLGPLAGIPVVVKESIDMAGFPSTGGWAPLASEAGGIDLIPAMDAPVVRRLREAGAVILGRSNIPPFSAAYNANDSWAGPTYNVWGRELSPGGSSAGSATAVSGNLTVVALAEETHGSVQVPASLQGIVGIKPTFGLVPNTGVMPIGGSTRDTVGAYGRTVEDAALLLDVLAGYDSSDPKTIASFGHIPADGYADALERGALAGLRIGAYGPGFEQTALSAETQALYDEALRELEALGAVIVPDPFAGTPFNSLVEEVGQYLGFEPMAYDFNTYLSRFGANAPADSLAELRAILSTDPFGDGNLPSFFSPPEMIADPVTPPDLSAFADAKTRFLAAFAQTMVDKDIDLFVFPENPTGALALDNPDHISLAVPETNIAGLPVVVVPGGSYAANTPFSLVFFGAPWSEPMLLGAAYDYEQATHHRVAPTLAMPN